jgi:hypothetical protein
MQVYVLTAVFGFRGPCIDRNIYAVRRAAWRPGKGVGEINEADCLSFQLA